MCKAWASHPVPLNQTSCRRDNQENEVVTLCGRITSAEDFLDNNVVKVLRDQKHQALYFSRAPIPCAPSIKYESIDNSSSERLRHVGIYGCYRCLKCVRSEPCDLELMGKLEQLRMLVHGIATKVVEAWLIRLEE